jgi:hypothetical protein
MRKRDEETANCPAMTLAEYEKWMLAEVGRVRDQTARAEEGRLQRTNYTQK